MTGFWWGVLAGAAGLPVAVFGGIALHTVLVNTNNAKLRCIRCDFHLQGWRAAPLAKWVAWQWHQRITRTWGRCSHDLSQEEIFWENWRQRRAAG